MISITIPTTATNPSGFGMPMSGHAFGDASWSCTTTPATGAVVRDREATLVKGYVRIQGTSAWRPPTL